MENCFYSATFPMPGLRFRIFCLRVFDLKDPECQIKSTFKAYFHGRVIYWNLWSFKIRIELNNVLNRISMC